MPRERVVCLKRDGGCGKRFWRAVGDDRERCEVCDPPAATGVVLRLQNDPTLPEVPDGPRSGADGPVERVLGNIESETLASLTKRKRLSTPEGALALTIARRLDSSGNTGSEIAAMSKALRETLRDALTGAPADEDALDDLTKRRAQRAGRGA